MLLVAFFLAAILGVQAVDVVMYVPDGGLDGLGRPRVGSYPTDIHPVLRAAFRQAALWKPPQIWCHDLPPGKCCNNVFGYGGVNFTGLRPGYVVSTWKRFGSIERWLEMQAWRAPILGDATTEHASNVRPYGCGGGVLDVGHGDDSGLWTRPNPVYATKATGSMWWNCGEDPASSLRALFMPKITGARSVLRSLIHIALYSCANLGSSIMPSIFPRSLETGPPSASVVDAGTPSRPSIRHAGCKERTRSAIGCARGGVISAGVSKKISQIGP